MERACFSKMLVSISIHRTVSHPRRVQSEVTILEVTMVTLAFQDGRSWPNRGRRSCPCPSLPRTNQASPTFSSGKIINLYAALLHEPACRTKTRERRGETAEPTQKINPVRYRLSCSGDISEQELHKSISTCRVQMCALQVRNEQWHCLIRGFLYYWSTISHVAFQYSSIYEKTRVLWSFFGLWAL
jgi:hypothetical protein